MAIVTAREKLTVPGVAKETPEKIHENAYSMELKSTELADMMLRRCVETKTVPDHLVAFARGGWPVMNMVARQIGYRAPELLSVHISSYTERDTEGCDEFEVGQWPPDELVYGKHLMMIDEVWDKGRTLSYSKQRFLRQGAAVVEAAVVYYKPKRNQVSDRPDLWVIETDSWVEFPGEAIEDSRSESPLERMRKGVWLSEPYEDLHAA